MTVQEIQEIGFEKAVFGGYDMKSVDTFLERVAEEFAAMQKENAAMKAKMKVLVDKIEEYRGVEEGMHRTLLTAQSIAQETIDKAKKEAEEIIASAKELCADPNVEAVAIIPILHLMLRPKSLVPAARCVSHPFRLILRSRL